VKQHCVAPTKKNGHKPTCKRVVTVGTVSFNGHGGVNEVAFQGRLSKARTLAPGRYTLRIVATVAGNSSKASTLTFTIVK
jgi:hypothetical protein